MSSRGFDRLRFGGDSPFVLPARSRARSRELFRFRFGQGLARDKGFGNIAFEIEWPNRQRNRPPPNQAGRNDPDVRVEVCEFYAI